MKFEPYKLWIIIVKFKSAGYPDIQTTELLF